MTSTGSLPIGSVLQHAVLNNALHFSPMASSSKPITVSPRSSGGISSVSTSGTVDSPQNRQLNTGPINSIQSNTSIN